MKKIMIFAAFAAALSLASCQKEALNEAAGTESPVFTATISTGTKTTVNATDGKVAWESTDKITITDASAASAIYKIKSIDGNTGKATFEVESGTLGQGPYTATYGTEPATAQTYAATPGNLYMTAPETSANSFTFTVQCGLMEINLTKADESVKSIAVTGTPTGKSETTYTLTCTQAQNIATKKSFYIALPAGSYNKIVITDSEDKVCTLTAASGITVAANHIKPVTFEGSKLDFLPKGALPGVFSVGPNATDKVHFSKGNLWADASGTTPVFYFESNQYNVQSSWSTSHVSHFFWSKDASVACAASYEEPGATSSDVFFTNETIITAKAGFTVNVEGKERSGWRTLCKEEWQYLFNTRSNASSLYMYGVTVCGKTNCLIIAPDGFTGSIAYSYDTSTWPEAEAAGLVCLPAAGGREGSDVNTVGDSGLCWSSTAGDENHAYGVYFTSSSVSPDYRDRRNSGSSVRLITESK